MSNHPSTPNEPSPAPQETVHHPSAVEQELKAHEVPEVLDFLRENGLSLLVGVGLAVAAFLGISAYRNYKTSQATAAANLFFQAQTTQQIQDMINQYPSATMTPLAYLALAAGRFDAGEYDLADRAFSEFETKFPNHPLVGQAQLGHAQCKEAGGQLQEALASYDQFATAHPNHYLYPVALFGKARTLEEMGRFPEARAVYEDYIALGLTNSAWTSRAEAALLYVDKEARAVKEGAAAAPPAAPVTLNPVPAVLPSQAPAESAP